MPTPTRSDRMRATGWLVIVGGLAGAAAFYWVRTQTIDPALDDFTALGYTRSMKHQMDEMMGPFGSMLTEWQQALTSPAGEALMIVGAAALLAGYFFRVAWVLDRERENPDERAGGR